MLVRLFLNEARVKKLFGEFCEQQIVDPDLYYKSDVASAYAYMAYTNVINVPRDCSFHLKRWHLLKLPGWKKQSRVFLRSLSRKDCYDVSIRICKLCGKVGLMTIVIPEEKGEGIHYGQML